MAAADDARKYDDLLAEVERSLGTPSPAAGPPAVPSASTPARRGSSTPAAREAPAGSGMPVLTRLLVFGVGAAVLVFLLSFFLLPILGPFAPSAWSAALGAFLGAGGTALVLRRR